MAIMITAQTHCSCFTFFLREGHLDLFGHITQGWTDGEQEDGVLTCPLLHELLTDKNHLISFCVPAHPPPPGLGIG